MLVWTVMSYGVEVWDWKEREGMERLQERFLRWMWKGGREDAWVFNKGEIAERKTEE